MTDGIRNANYGASNMETVGLFIEDFDPPHLIHLSQVIGVLTNHYLDRVLIIPTCRQKYTQFDFKTRYEMCVNTFSGLPNVEVSKIENDVRSLSSLETITALCSHHYNWVFKLITHDKYPYFDEEMQDIQELVSLIELPNYDTVEFGIQNMLHSSHPDKVFNFLHNSIHNLVVENRCKP